MKEIYVEYRHPMYLKAYYDIFLTSTERDFVL